MKNNEMIYSRLTLAIICLTVIALTIRILSIPIQLLGEVDTYILPTLSIQDRLSLYVNQSDIDMAQVDFPDLYHRVRSYDDLRTSKLVFIEDNKWVSWYFPTYSMAAIPMKIMLEAIGGNQSYTFLLTNVLFFFLALMLVYRKLRTSARNRFYTVLLLVFNPIIFYIVAWMSAESFIFSLVVMSLVFYTNKEYKKAAIFVSLAGSLNPTIMIYGAMIIASYLIDILGKAHEEKGNHVFIDRIPDILIFGMCFVPSIVPFLFNYVSIGNINQTMQNASVSHLWNRFFSYLFDLNLGFLPMVPLVIIFFFFFIFLGLRQRDSRTVLYMISLFGTVLAYSLMPHINSGMTGISRYDSWSLPIMIFYVTTVGYTYIKKDSLNHAYIASIYISSALSIGILIGFSKNPSALSYLYHNPIASTVLNNIPQLYNPYYATFISRTEHVDGGYIYGRPVIYSDNHGGIRKIMATRDTLNDVQNLVIGDSASMEALNKKIMKVKNRNGYIYINIPKSSGCDLVIKNPTVTYVLVTPLTIEPNTLYEIAADIEFKSNSANSVKERFFIDLYGSNGAYDNSDQEIHLELMNGKNTYHVSINSGNDSDVQNGYVRIVYFGNGELALRNISVVKEME